MVHWRLRFGRVCEVGFLDKSEEEEDDDDDDEEEEEEEEENNVGDEDCEKEDEAWKI